MSQSGTVYAMEPQGQEIYNARVKAGLEKIGLGKYYDGKHSLVFRSSDFNMRLFEIDLSAIDPDKYIQVILSRIYIGGKHDGYEAHREEFRRLAGL